MRRHHRGFLAIVLTILAMVSVVAAACDHRPTTTPTATTTSTPRPVPTPSTDAIAHTGGLSVQRLTERAMAHLGWLSQELGPRPSASPLEEVAAQYISDQLRSYGYPAELQEFTADILEEGQNLRVKSPVELTPTTSILTGSGTGEVTAPLLSAGLGRVEELPQAAFHGAIALIRRGEISFRQKIENAVRFGV